MEIKKNLKLLTVSAIASAVLVGCGSSGDSSTTDTTQTGTFIDAPVKGLYYKTASQEGYTNDSGEFSYKTGESVEFKLGNLSFGSVSAGSLITPYTLAGDTNISNPSAKAQNIAMLLQNFDLNRSNTAVLDISKLKDYDFSDVNISDITANMETKIQNVSAAIIAHANFGASFLDTNTTLIDASSASSAMQSFIESNSVKYDNKFTTTYLNDKTFYNVVYWDSWVITDDTFNANGSLDHNNTPDGNFTESWSITSDGKIEVDTGDGTFNWNIVAITDDYIQVNADSANNANDGYFYFDETKAQAKLANLQSNEVSVANGFGAEWLKNNLLYEVILDTEDDDNDGSTTDYLVLKRTSTSTQQSYDFNGDNVDDTVVNYTIENGGVIKIIDGSDWETYTVSAVDSTKITVTVSVSWSVSDEIVYFFYNKTDAQNYLNTL